MPIKFIDMWTCFSSVCLLMMIIQAIDAHACTVDLYMLADEHHACMSCRCVCEAGSLLQCCVRKHVVFAGDPIYQLNSTDYSKLDEVRVMCLS